MTLKCLTLTLGEDRKEAELTRETEAFLVEKFQAREGRGEKPGLPRLGETPGAKGFTCEVRIVWTR